MARVDRRRAKSTKPTAGVGSRPPKQAKAPSIEDTMFFPRLRRHAKWMFVFLAVALGGGFVVFGVGAGGTGIGDILRDGGRSDGLPSISDSRQKTQENPKDAKAWRDLSTALQTDGETAEAVSALTTYISLRPKNADARRELAGLYLSQASEQQREAQTIQLQAQYSAAGQNFPGLLQADGQVVVGDKIGEALNAGTTAKLNVAAAAAQAAYANAVAAYQEIAELQPDDPNVQLELASTAQQAGDTGVAIDAYERFLKLAPDDANAAIVKQQLAQLRALQG
jgi:tetratricopeptide (TPR) repeat protein